MLGIFISCFLCAMFGFSYGIKYEHYNAKNSYYIKMIHLMDKINEMEKD